MSKTDPPTIELRSHGWSPVEHTTSKLHRVFTAEPGLMHSINWHIPAPGEPAFEHCHAWVNAPSGQPDASAIGVGGTALTREVALAKAIGEAVERYCGSVYDVDSIRVASCAKLGERAVDPRRFVLFHDSQYEHGLGLNRVDESSELGWSAGYSLTKNRPAWIPASIVHTGYQGLGTGEPFELAPVSGYACGNTLEEALLGGICEVVERDAFMLHWYQRLPSANIDLRTLQSSEAQDTLARYRDCPVRLFCADITTDVGIPAVAAVMTSRHPQWPAAVVAAASSLDPERAAVRALQELASNHLYVRDCANARTNNLPTRPEQVTGMEEHGLLYTTPQWLTQLGPLLRPDEWRSLDADAGLRTDDVKIAVEHCVAKLDAAGLEVLFVDLTTPEVEALGLKVVKVLIPGMQPMDFGLSWQHLGGRRLYEVPERLGHKDWAESPDQLNTFPHPFP